MKVYYVVAFSMGCTLHSEHGETSPTCLATSDNVACHVLGSEEVRKQELHNQAGDNVLGPESTILQTHSSLLILIYGPD